jgi:hypothetical protein
MRFVPDKKSSKEGRLSSETDTGPAKGNRIADRKDSKIDSNRKEGNTAMYLRVDRMGGR